MKQLLLNKLFLIITAFFSVSASRTYACPTKLSIYNHLPTNWSPLELHIEPSSTERYPGQAQVALLETIVEAGNLALIEIPSGATVRLEAHEKGLILSSKFSFESTIEHLIDTYSSRIEVVGGEGHALRIRKYSSFDEACTKAQDLAQRWASKIQEAASKAKLELQLAFLNAKKKFMQKTAGR